MSDSIPNQPALLPTLRRDIRVLPGGIDENGETTWSLFDPVSDKYFRIGWREREIIARFTGGKTAEDLLADLAKNGVDATRGEIVGIGNFLINAHLCLPVPDKTADRLLKENEIRRGALILRILYSYISFRVPLWRPDEFLSSTVDVVRVVFNRWTLTALAVVSLSGYLRLFPNWNRLTETFMASLSVVGLLNYTIAILAVKFIHELCHAYAAKIHGVRAREFGVAFIVFLPRLYTDLTDSWRITDRRQRLLIDAAGILAELLIGGLAALVWANTGAGAVHAIAYFLFAVSVINSLLFNGNPLMRFDGYYVLSDAINIDNLQRKAFAVIKSSWRRWCWGLTGPIPYGTTKRLMLSLYGVAAFCYRLFLYSSIIAVIYYKFTKAMGMTLACVEVFLLLVVPVSRELARIKTMCAKMKKRFYPKLIIFLAMLAGLLLIPFPVNTPLPSEIRSERKSVVYVKTEGFVEHLDVTDGTPVTAGTQLLSLNNPFLQMEKRQKEIDRKILALEMDQLRSRSSTLKNRGIKQEQLKVIDAVLDELAGKENNLRLRADLTGTVLFYHEDLDPGEWLRRGFPVGEVYDPNQAVIVAYASESDLSRLAVNDSINLCLDREITPIKGRIKQIQTVPLYHIRSSPLQSARGGPLPGRNVNGRWKSSAPLFRVVIAPETKLGEYHLGRSGTSFVKHHVAIGPWLFRAALRFLEKEFVF